MTEKSSFDSRQEQEIFFFSRASLGLTQLSIHSFLPMALSPGIKRLSHDMAIHKHFLLRLRML
jgi:hypothetical protein